MGVGTGVAGALVETALIFVMIAPPSPHKQEKRKSGVTCVPSDQSKTKEDVVEKSLLLRRIKSKGRNRRENCPQQRFATSLAGDGDPVDVRGKGDGFFLSVVMDFTIAWISQIRSCIQNQTADHCCHDWRQSG